MLERTLLPYNYKLASGRIANDYEVEEYNRIQARINYRIAGGFPVSEELLNESHHCMKLMLERPYYG